MTEEIERFRAKWVPVRVKKTRQNKKLELAGGSKAHSIFAFAAGESVVSHGN
jgi:hypothetical protein